MCCSHPYYAALKGKDLGMKTWPPDAWKIGGGGAWGFVSYDPDTDQIFYGTANPGPWDTDVRPGANLWTSGVFARNPENGEAHWFVDMTPHDPFDYDGINESLVLDLPINGQTRKVVVHVDRNGYVYVIDRTNGQILSATQYGYINTINGIDLNTGRPRFNEEKLPRMNTVVHQMCPGAVGAKDWQPSAFSAPRAEACCMCSRFRSVFVSLVLACVSGTASAQSELRVCADGDNLPYSNQKQQGLDNKIAELLARDMNARLTYYWSRMGRGYIRDVLNAGLCDVLIEIPTDFRHALTTPAFYRSSYVFITRKDRGLNIRSLDDERLRTLRVGVQIVAENYSPPGRALGRRGIYSNLVGFESTGDDAKNIISAVADGKVDVAIAWGPLAGYYAAKQQVPLEITPVTPESDAGVPFTYAISMGVKKGNVALRDKLTQFLERDHDQIEAVLRQYNVPLLPVRPTERASADK